MFCVHCGTRADDAATFCSSCGKAVGASGAAPAGPAAAQQRGRVAGHVQLAGILWLAVAAFRVIPGLALITIFRSDFFPPDVPPFVHGMLRSIGVLFLIGGALSVIAGCGLLTRQPWARMLAIVLGALSLVDIPFGTALGIYTLWVLLPSQSEQEYRAMVA